MGIVGHAVRMCAVVLLAGLLGASLIEFAPGLDTDERENDPRFSSGTLDTIRSERAARPGPISSYGHLLAGFFRGDFGISQLYSQPVSQLIRERLPVTSVSVGAGLGAGWVFGIAIACAAALSRGSALPIAAAGLSTAFLSIPSGLLAITCLVFGMPPAIAIAAVVFPRVFTHGYTQLCAGLDMPHVVMARALGVKGARTFWFYVAPGALPALITLAGVTVPLAIGATIPVEALSDSPGVGQLAWRAALGRDVPLVVGITMILAAVTALANLASDIASKASLSRRSA